MSRSTFERLANGDEHTGFHVREPRQKSAKVAHGRCAVPAAQFEIGNSTGGKAQAHERTLDLERSALGRTQGPARVVASDQRASIVLPEPAAITPSEYRDHQIVNEATEAHALEVEERRDPRPLPEHVVAEEVAMTDAPWQRRVAATGVLRVLRADGVDLGAQPARVLPLHAVEAAEHVCGLEAPRPEQRRINHRLMDARQSISDEPTVLAAHTLQAQRFTVHPRENRKGLAQDLFDRGATPALAWPHDRNALLGQAEQQRGFHLRSCQALLLVNASEIAASVACAKAEIRIDRSEVESLDFTHVEPVTSADLARRFERQGAKPSHGGAEYGSAVEACEILEQTPANVASLGLVRSRMVDVYGNKTGLAPSALRSLERIYRRRVPSDRIVTPELVRSLAEASRETGRQVGALVHRSGEIDYVIVGSATSLMLPDIGRLRAAEGRFRALRLVHTHLFGEPLTRDDLVDLTRLRLDLVAAVLLTREGEPRSLTWAYNVPARDDQSRPYEVAGPFPYGHPEPNFGELIASLEAEFAQKRRARSIAKDGRAILVHVGEKRQRGAQSRAASRLGELTSLARTAGVEVVDSVIQLRDRPDPRSVVGPGKLDEILMRAIDLDAETLIFDCELTPSQASGISTKTDLKVIDRTQLILDIFAQHAESRDGKLQVELAQLKYALPRLGQKDDSLSRLTGGIGGRGPGETKLEIGRRRARERVNRLERELAALAGQRRERRRKRQESDLPVVALVGYTNAGKSTLLNSLTAAGVLAEDKLFATLDPRARRLSLPDGRVVVLTDTVGFIRNMPDDLFSTFRSTFEEAADADLLIEVVDASDPEYEEHLEATHGVLEDLELSERPRLAVYNKVDRLSPDERIPFASGSGRLGLSANDPSTLAPLLAAISKALPRLGHGERGERSAEPSRALP